MSIVINSNLASINAYRNLNRTQAGLTVSLQRLSSGLRINSAKDDASGLAITEGLSSKIRGNAQARRNAADGISLGQTAESALAQINDNLQRIREVAIQAANGSLGDSERGQLQKEVDQLTQETSRIIDTSKFNGQSLLASQQTLSFQVGYNGVSNNRISVEMSDLTTHSDTVYGAALEMVTALNSANYNDNPAPWDDTTGGDPADGAATQVLVNLENIYGSSSAEYTAARDVGLQAKNEFENNGSDAAAYESAKTVAATAAQAYDPGGGVPALSSYNSNLSASSTINISTQANAQNAISNIDSDIDRIINTRATFGALQNRFEAVIANLQANEESYTATRSRIQDADFSSETANLTRSQILQQAGVSVLSQANSLPQIALNLLS